MNCDNQCCENHGHEHCHDRHELAGDWYGINVNTLAHTNELLLVEQAAELVPVDMRKPGTKITFWTYSGWETWQFVSKDIREWPLREAWKQESVYGMDNIKDLQNQIDSIQIGGWAISQEFGDDEHIGISQKKLTEEFNNVARLDVDGKVPPSQLPSYVDDVIDGYYYNNAFYANAEHTQLLDAETGKIYVDVPSKVSYRYSGSAYIAISNPYLPDEEDITAADDVLKFKDKSYSAAVYSGLGKKYLRKNMVGGVNTLTQAMVNTPNTGYVIQYDYDLDGQTINLPQGCVLYFDGGSFKNGRCVSNDTVIIGDCLNSNALCGAFKDEFGTYIGVEKSPLHRYYFEQKMAISNTEFGSSYKAASCTSDDNYFYFLLNKDDDSDCLIFVTDNNYHRIGTTSYGAGHGNSCCIRDGVFYVTSAGVKSASVATILSNIQSELATVLTPVTIDAQVESVQNLGYDDVTDRFYIDNRSGVLYELDNTWTVIRTFTSPFYTYNTYLDSTGMNRIRNYSNEYVVRNGLAVIGASVKNSNITNDPMRGYIAVVDIYANKVIHSQTVEAGLVLSNEVEGITYKNGNFYLHCYSVRQGSVQGNAVIECSQTKAMTNTSYSWISVDNNSTETPCGLRANPYTSLYEVTANLAGHVGYHRITLGYSENVYKGYLQLSNIYATLDAQASSFDGDAASATITSAISLRGAFVSFTGLNFTNCSISIYGGKVVFENCTFTESYITTKGGDVDLVSCTVNSTTNNHFITTSYDYIRVNLGFSSCNITCSSLFSASNVGMYIKSCTITCSGSLFSTLARNSIMGMNSILTQNTITATSLNSASTAKFQWIEVVTNDETYNKLISNVSGLSTMTAGEFLIWFLSDSNTSYKGKGYAYMDNYKKIHYLETISSSTANRPTDMATGTSIYDTTLGKPIWYNGSAWVDSTGTAV